VQLVAAMEGKAAMVGIRELESLAAGFAPGPLLVHSDVMKAAAFAGEYRGKEAFLQSHWEVLQQIAQGRPIWLPSYNYDFPKTGIFDVQRCPSQVGALSEFVRRRHAHWRTNVPVYSIVGTGPPPTYPQEDIFYPFGAHSAFEQLLAQEGHLLFYGAAYVNTFGHYLEQLGNNLHYRYPKRFPGQLITTAGQSRQVAVEYHCRPLGQTLEYDVDGILQDLQQQGIAEFLAPDNHIMISIRTRSMADYWLARFKDEPYFLLTEQTRNWVVEKVQQLGRPFCLNDFEPAEATRAAG
jgi:aminoglycoside N3'-acetyltransferase